MTSSRRKFLATLSAAAVGLRAQAPAIVTPDRARPAIPYGVASGDVTANSAILWSRSDRPARMIVEYSTTESFSNVRRAQGPTALEATDFTSKLDLSGLPPGQRIFYRVLYEDLANSKIRSAPVTGSFQTAPAVARDITLAFSADTAGQGFGINPEWGGFRLYETMRRERPDFFINSGDMIYADGPILPEVKLDDGKIWKNLTTPAKSKVAETLADFRGNYAYNLMDENMRRFAAEVPQVVQWDDHETRDNWWPGQTVSDTRYTERNASILSARGRRAFFEYTPIRRHPGDPDRIYRSLRHGALLETFLLDERSYRGPNSPNNQTVLNKQSAFLGPAQLDWLKRRLLASTATWKLIASDMPIGLIVTDARNFEAVANGDGPPLGRELEIVDLLRFIKRKNIRNVVWVTADVHYCAAHYYDPRQAQFADFDPFWEFVAGPLNAGTFGPGKLDNTFGPQLKFIGIPPGMKPRRPPSDGFQFFGLMKIAAASRVLTASLHDLEGRRLYSVDLEPETRG